MANLFRNKQIILIFFLLIFFCFPYSSQAQSKNSKKEKGKLADFEDKIKEKKEEPEDDSNHRSHSGIFFFIESPGDIFFLPRLLIGTFPGEDSLFYEGRFWHRHFSDYPYWIKNEGIYSRRTGKKISIHFAGHYFYNSSVLQGFHINGRIYPLPFLGLEFRYTDLTEKLHTRNDHLRLYDAYINYDRIRSRRWVLWWGLGVKGLQGDDTYHGLSFNFGTEIYPKNPISLNMLLNVGSLNSQTVSEFQIKVNWHIQRDIIYLGYQYFSTGGLVLDGIIFGLGIFL